MQQIRPAACAGTFYPGTEAELRESLASLLAPKARSKNIKALIAPHAGYIYSGAIAASAYARIGENFSRVVILGPAHRQWFRGIAIPSARAFSTPLGSIEIDHELAKISARLPGVFASDEPHRFEHSLEVQLPFLQRTLADFSILPLLVGEAKAAEVAEIIEALWQDEDTLVVASSDLSHYLPYREAKARDERTARAISALDPILDHEDACSATAVNALILAAKNSGLRPELLDLRNSGDTAGDPSRVVGYAAFSFSGSDPWENI